VSAGTEVSRPTPRTALSPLERFLRLFTEMRAGEGTTGLVMFANVFLILCAYYFVKPLRDGWVAVSPVGGLSKMEVKAYTNFAQSFFLLPAVAVYAGMARRLPRGKLITRATLFCMSNLLVFWLLQPGLLGEGVPGAGIAFYVWVGMFGVFVPAQFWAFAADLYTDERGRRLLPFIAVGATAGAVAGSYLTGLIVESRVLDSGALLLAANLPLAASILLTRWADRRGATGEGPDHAPAAASGSGHGAGGDALRLVLHHRYLLPVALVVLLGNWVNTNGENLLFRVVQEVLDHNIASQGLVDPHAVSAYVREGTTAFYGDFFFWVNTFALVLQALFASRLLRYGGFGLILLMLPTISLASYTAMALVPVITVVKAMKIAENSTNYSVNNTARHVLWLPTTAEMKYQAKPAIDTFVVRVGDGLAAATVLLGVQVWALSTRSFFVFNMSLVLVWLAASFVVIREYRRLAGGSGVERANP
jgi:AAA family ATP:ADP antiporter